MIEQDFKKLVAKKLAEYRRLNNLTQLELAEKLNYSDKSISKWERGDGLPDIYVLHTIAEFYGITVNDLLSDAPAKKPRKRLRTHIIVPLLSVAIVWLVAIMLYMFLGRFLPELNNAWFTFIFALPASMIVLTVYSSIWWDQVLNLITVSGIIWTVALCFSVCINGLELIWLVAAVLQVMEIMWFILRFKKRKKSS